MIFGYLSNFFTTNAFTFPLALTNGFKGPHVLRDHTDVSLAPLASGDILGWDALTSFWTNGPAPAGGSGGVTLAQLQGATNTATLNLQGLALVSQLESTNGFVGPGITNGLVGQDIFAFLTANYYPLSNPSGYVGASVTNGLVGQDVFSMTNGLVGPGVTNGLIGQAPSDGSYYAQLNGSWAAIPFGANQTYYFYPTNSDVANYLGDSTDPDAVQTILTKAGFSSGTTVVTNWITPPGSPGVSFIPAGQYEFHIHAAKSAGVKSALLYAEIWEANAAGADIFKIGTTESSPTLAGSETEYRLFFGDGDVYSMASTASRIDCRVYTTVSGAGTAPTVQLYIGGESDSHISLPATVLVPPIALVTVNWTNVYSLTNSGSQTVDMQLKEADFQTNATFAFLGIRNKSTTNYQSIVRTVYNSGGATIAILAPPNTFTNGTLPYLCTNGGYSKVLLSYHPTYNYTSMYVFPEK